MAEAEEREGDVMTLDMERKASRSESKYEQFSARSGQLIEKTFWAVAKPRGIEVSVLRLRDLLSE